MTIGDVLAALAVLTVIGVGWGATLLTAALAFPERTRGAAEQIAEAPGRCAGRGVAIFAGVGLLALALTHAPAGPVRLVGDLIWAALALATAVGVAGLARLLSERIVADGTTLGPFAALTRSTALLVLAGCVPVIGWFLVTPLVTWIALGSVVRRTAPRRMPIPDRIIEAGTAANDRLPGAVS